MSILLIINVKILLHVNITKYFGMTLDKRLKLKENVKKKEGKSEYKMPAAILVAWLKL